MRQLATDRARTLIEGTAAAALEAARKRRNVYDAQHHHRLPGKLAMIGRHGPAALVAKGSATLSAKCALSAGAHSQGFHSGDRVPISAEAADLFRVIGLNLKIAILPFMTRPLCATCR